MIGTLFHGPEIFDSGWALKMIQTVSAIDRVRCVLAGTMGRTAAIDSGLQNIEFPGQQPSRILRDLQGSVDSILFANFGKSEESGLLHGAMIAEKAAIPNPFLQVECSGRCYVEWNEGSHPAVIRALENLGFRKRERIAWKSTFEEREGRVSRRLTTAAAGDFVLVDGIVIGRALGKEILIECRHRRIIEMQGVAVKPHGLEKLQRLGGIDLRTAKIASTPALRRPVPAARIARSPGHGVAFIDHAGMQVYDRLADREGAVTVGDDTTAIVGDILSRFQIPLIGITDGDKDSLLEKTQYAAGSVVLTVAEDDRTGLLVSSEIFHRRPVIEEGFAAVRDRILSLLGPHILHRQDY